MSARLRFSIQTDAREDLGTNECFKLKLYRISPGAKQTNGSNKYPDIVVPVEFTEEEFRRIDQTATQQGKSIDDLILESIEEFLEDYYLAESAEARLNEFEKSGETAIPLEKMKSLYVMED